MAIIDNINDGTIADEYITQDVNFKGVSQLKILKYLSSMTLCCPVFFVRISTGFGDPIYLYLEEPTEIDVAPTEITIDVSQYQGVYILEIGVAPYELEYSPTWDFIFDVHEVWLVGGASYGRPTISCYSHRRGIGISSDGGVVPWGP